MKNIEKHVLARLACQGALHPTRSDLHYLQCPVLRPRGDALAVWLDCHSTHRRRVLADLHDTRQRGARLVDPLDDLVLQAVEPGVTSASLQAPGSRAAIVSCTCLPGGF